MNVLITGSSRGLGRSLALAFAYAEEDHNIILHGRDELALNVLCTEIRNETGSDCDIVHGDITEVATIDRLYQVALKWNIDGLINNAGVYTGDKIIDTNLLAPILLTSRLYEIFKAKRYGLIVNINSLAGKTFNSMEAAYCASKWGLRGFMGSLRYEARSFGVNILDVYLGAMQTRITKGRLDYDRLMDPDEVAKVIYGLCKNYRTIQINEIEIGRAS